MTDDNMLCPYCQEEVKVGAIKCKHCKTDLISTPQKVTAQTQNNATSQKQAKIKKPFWRRWWVWTAAIIVVIAIVGSGGDKDTGSAPSSNQDLGPEVSAPEAAAPEPMVVTVDQIVDDLKKNALSAANTYQDQYVELTGELVNIDSSGQYFSLGPLSDDFSFDSVLCNIKSEHLDQVMQFETGQQVTATGTITSVGEVLGYTLQVETIK